MAPIGQAAKDAAREGGGRRQDRQGRAERADLPPREARSRRWRTLHGGHSVRLMRALAAGPDQASARTAAKAAGRRARGHGHRLDQDLQTAPADPVAESEMGVVKQAVAAAEAARNARAACGRRSRRLERARRRPPRPRPKRPQGRAIEERRRRDRRRPTSGETVASGGGEGRHAAQVRADLDRGRSRPSRTPWPPTTPGPDRPHGRPRGGSCRRAGASSAGRAITSTGAQGYAWQARPARRCRPGVQSELSPRYAEAITSADGTGDCRSTRRRPTPRAPPVRRPERRREEQQHRCGCSQVRTPTPAQAAADEAADEPRGRRGQPRRGVGPRRTRPRLTWRRRSSP